VLYRSDNLFNISLSPNGQWLALLFSSNEKQSLNIILAAGGEPRELCRFEKADGFTFGRNCEITWTDDGKYIFYTVRDSKSDDQKRELCRIPAEGGEPQKLGLKMSEFVNLSIHPDGRHIAFSSREKSSSEVWVMKNFLPETPVAKPEPVVTLRKTGHDWGKFASLSPDGKYMCDVDWVTENLVVRELATGKVRALTRKGASETAYPLDSAISPDSSQVAYLWWDYNTKSSSLCSVGLDDSGLRFLRRGGYPMPKDWSPDGKNVLAVVEEDDTQQMVWISASDGSIEHITSVGKGYPGKFDVSPDGRFIAYDRPQVDDTSKRDVFVFDLSEKRETSVVKHPTNDKLLGWTPDGRSIFFASDRTGTWDSWLLQVAGGKSKGYPKLVKHGIGNVAPIGFTPNGSYYYGHEQTLNDVFVATLDLETGKVLSEPMPVRQSGTTTCHDWSPDGRYLAYCTRRPDESQSIHVRTLATGQERMLADNLTYIRWLRWSLDERSILIDRFKKGDSQGVIFKIDIQTGERTDLVRSETERLVRPELSPDGKTLFYGRGDPDSKTGRLVARDLESGREKDLLQVVPPVRVTGSALSPDGQWFVLSIINSATRPAAPVLKILSIAGGEPRELIQFDKSEGLLPVGVAWMPDSRNVVFWKWFLGDRERELWRISAEGGEPRKLWARKALGHLRVHPDGQRIAFYSRSRTSEVWVMENFLPTAVASAGK
jgi:Tol biopolymer transport system component